MQQENINKHIFVMDGIRDSQFVVLSGKYVKISCSCFFALLYSWACLCFFSCLNATACKCVIFWENDVWDGPSVKKAKIAAFFIEKLKVAAVLFYTKHQTNCDWVPFYFCCWISLTTMTVKFLPDCSVFFAYCSFSWVSPKNGGTYQCQ